jgi:hypothetical protein
MAENIAEAAQKFDIVQGSPTTLLLDLDTPEALAQFERVLPKIHDNFGVTGVQTWRSKSGNTHKVVALACALTADIRVALQASLGSDGVKEALSVQRFLNGCEEPSVLFRPKDATVREER